MTELLFFVLGWWAGIGTLVLFLEITYRKTGGKS